MVIGNALTFAISFELDAHNYGGAWLFGKISYCIGGKQIGNHDLGTSLRDVLVCMETIIKFNGGREDKEFFKSPTDLAYFSIDASIFGLFGEDTKQDVIRCDNTDRFNISPWVDVFDYVKIFLIDNDDGQSKLIYRDLKTRIVQEMIIQRGIVDDALRITSDYLSMLLQKEAAPLE